MDTKNLISLLVTFAILSVPGAAIAGKIDLNTGGARATTNVDGTIKVQSEKSKINVGSQDLRSPSYYLSNWKPRNYRIINNPWLVKPIIIIPKTQNTCKSSSSRYQSSQIRRSGNNVIQSQSSMSVCS
jgi:hypothetical protein